MKTIYKYQIPIADEFKLKLPKDALILSFQVQNGTPVLWVMVNTEAEQEERNFLLFGTGHPIRITEGKHNLQFIGTIQQSENPPLVWHLFEEKMKSPDCLPGYAFLADLRRYNAFCNASKSWTMKNNFSSRRPL